MCLLKDYGFLRVLRLIIWGIIFALAGVVAPV